MIIIDILLLFCIIIVYVLIAQAVAFIPFYIIGFIKNFIDDVFRKSIDTARKARELRYMANFELLFGIFFSFVYLFAHFRYQLWTNSQIYLWSNPILFLILYIRSTIGASVTESSNPILRRLSSMVWFALIPIMILMIIGTVNSEFIPLWSIKWGVATGVSVPLLVSMIWGRFIPSEMERFENLENRQKQIEKKIDTLSHVVNVIGDMGESKDLSNLYAELNQRSSKMAYFLRQGKFPDAENLIIQSEIDANQIEENLENRIRYSLKEEIRTRLEQARLDIQRLRQEFKSVLISTERLDELDSKIQEYLSKINLLKFSTERIPEQIDPFEKVIASIADIKTGLRLRKNVGSRLDIIRREIDDSQLLLDIASNLGLETEVSQIAMKQTFSLLDVFQKEEMMSADEPINLYRSLQSNLSKFRESVAILKANINRNWTWYEAEAGQFISCIPKYCRTDRSASGVLVLKSSQNILQQVNVTIDGTLLEFETDRNIIMSPKGDFNYAISSFNFAGKRPGHGTVKLRSKELKDLQSSINFPIRIIPTATELATNSLLYGASFGGFILIVFWQLGYAPKDYSSLAAAIGGTLSVILFIFRYINISKYK